MIKDDQENDQENDQEKLKLYLKHLSLEQNKMRGKRGKSSTMWMVCIMMISKQMGLDVVTPDGTSHFDHNINLEKKIIQKYPEYFL